MRFTKYLLKCDKVDQNGMIHKKGSSINAVSVALNDNNSVIVHSIKGIEETDFSFDNIIEFKAMCKGFKK